MADESAASRDALTTRHAPWWARAQRRSWRCQNHFIVIMSNVLLWYPTMQTFATGHNRVNSMLHLSWQSQQCLSWRCQTSLSVICLWLLVSCSANERRGHLGWQPPSQPLVIYDHFTSVSISMKHWECSIYSVCTLLAYLIGSGWNKKHNLWHVHHLLHSLVILK